MFSSRALVGSCDSLLKSMCGITLTFRSSFLTSIQKGKQCNYPSRIKVDPLWHVSKNRQDPVASTLLTMPPRLKKVSRKKGIMLESDNKKTQPLVVAYASAEEYDLVKLADALTSDGVYKKVQLADDAAEDVLHVVAAYTVTDEPREVFFFREGTSIFWNVDELEQCNILSVLEPFENGPYNRDLVRDEREVMPYLYQDKLPRTFVRQDTVHLTTRHLDREEPSDNIQLDKFAVSNALSSSVKLGMWEAILDAYVEDVEDVTKELKEGSGVHLTRRDALKKMGELFAIRHGVNLSSDLLDTPDFYWEREALETLYNQLASCLSIPKRTKVLNEKLSHCCEMMELVLAELSDKKHVRLEWLIIILIAVEIFIEVGRLIVGH